MSLVWAMRTRGWSAGQCEASLWDEACAGGEENTCPSVRQPRDFESCSLERLAGHRDDKGDNGQSEYR